MYIFIIKEVSLIRVSISLMGSVAWFVIGIVILGIASISLSAISKFVQTIKKWVLELQEVHLQSAGMHYPKH